MNNQTAVEWLEKAILLYVERCDLHKEFEQAKEMEKNQIIRAHLMARCYDTKNSVNEAEQYYNKTYESNTCLLNDGCDGISCFDCINNRNI